MKITTHALKCTTTRLTYMYAAIDVMHECMFGLDSIHVVCKLRVCIIYLYIYMCCRYHTYVHVVRIIYIYIYTHTHIHIHVVRIIHMYM